MAIDPYIYGDFTEADFPDLAEDPVEPTNIKQIPYDRLSARERAELEQMRESMTSHDWDTYWNRYGVKDQRSFTFKVGKQLNSGSLLTVVGPGLKNMFGRMTWQLVKCKCVCGKEVNVPYMQAFRAPAKYSCGCQMRMKVTDQNHEGKSVTRNGRTLTILFRDESTGGWFYVCDCCGEVDLLERGATRGPVIDRLKAAARQICPHAKT